MTPGVEQLRPYLHAFDFENLFIEGLGWNHYRGSPVQAAAPGGHDYSLRPLAEKAGFVIYLCSPDAAGGVPPYPVRRKIERDVAKLAFEHLIIFVDAAGTTQVWQWVKRESGTPAVCREHAFRAGQSGDPLLQRLRTLAFSLNEEAGLSIPVVADRVRQAMDVERLTKRFYERFRKELSAFSEFIDGIEAHGDRAWYASLMLNRMMFVYFVQKQGFLDDDPDYLRNRLAMVQGLQRGNGDSRDGRFHRFYRFFLRRLFHEGLGQPEPERAPELAALMGKIPFLNGGLFEVHDLERDYPEIDIPDEAFARVFEFFDGYRWHLDERPSRADNEINPDVLGYIFEKYVNQKQMGAYYTKEDVTGYMARNTVIPFLFDAARKKCPVAFQPGGGVWRLLQDDPDRYIHAALRDDLPDRAGAIALRDRRRYAEVRAKLASGEVRAVNDLITLNLDLNRFAHDAIVRSEGPDLLRAFWQAVRDVSVLDPTCGSGAFLFAALTILEPLYAACLEGMRGFLDDLQRTGRPHHPRALQDFRDVLAQVDRHPSVRYFILKSIVLNNLYGVDIMEEAVEICMLRLFLKLVAQLERYDQIEPLPDIDFNIRTGNTLVGFTSLEAVRRAISMDGEQVRALYGEDHATLARIAETAEIASRAFDQFRLQQTTLGGSVTAADKANLRRRLDALDAELNRFLANEYHIKPAGRRYDAWRGSHRPFHWFVEFYGIMNRGGFDVVIGNPPYVARRTVARSYRLKGFDTGDCPDIYAPVLERSIHVCRAGGRISMIVPLSLTFSSGFAPLRTLIYESAERGWFSSFGRIPSALFSFDTRVRNTIFLGHKGRARTTSRRFFTTRLHRWFDTERATLFERMSYSEFLPAPFGGLVPKLDSPRLMRAFENLLTSGDYRLKSDLAPSAAAGYPLHFKQTAYNWLTFCIEKPPASDLDGHPVHQTGYGTVHVLKEEQRDLSMILANGLLMFTWWILIGDDFHLTKGNFASAPLGPGQLSAEQRALALELRPELEEEMRRNLVFKRNAGKNIGNYNLARCRRVTDEADRLWLDALGLDELWEDLVTEHALVVRTSFDDESAG